MRLTFMTCEEAQRLLPLLSSAELDELEVEGAELLRQHVAACDRCATEARIQQECDARLREACSDELTDSAALQARIQSQLRAISLPWWQRMLNWQLHWSGTPAIALTLATLLVLVGGTWYRLHSVRVSLPVASARDHIRCVVHHEHDDWHTQPREMSAFLEQHLGSAQPIDYQSLGLHLVRTRICNLGGPRFVHLVLADDQQREISLYIRRSAERLIGGNALDDDGKPTLHYDHVGSFQIASFESGQKTIVLLTSLTAGGTERLAERLRAQLS